MGDEVVLLFGGRDGDGRPLADLHVVRADDLSFEVLGTTGSGPTARWAATLIHDATRGRTLLFGGTDGSAANAETWSLAAP